MAILNTLPEAHMPFLFNEDGRVQMLEWANLARLAHLWRVIETAYHITYASGGVNDLGTLLELPASLSGNEYYPGHMQLQIGCLRNGTYEWPY